MRQARRFVRCAASAAARSHEVAKSAFVFSPENFQKPSLAKGLHIREIRPEVASDTSLAGLGRLVHHPEEFTVGARTFEITRWPQPGWRPLDPGTGDEAGTTEGDFEVKWQGDYFHGHNLAIATENNKYLDGLGAMPEEAVADKPADAGAIYLWMSDYHPDGGQLFWPRTPVPFTVCLGPASIGDDIKPEDMRAFHVPRGKGIYIHPGTWHNGIYVAPRHASSPVRFLTRQGRVHARISVSWAAEFGKPPYYQRVVELFNDVLKNRLMDRPMAKRSMRRRLAQARMS